MKTLIHILAGLFCTLSYACRKDELVSFNQKPKVYIYKRTQAPVSPVKDSATYSFAIKPTSVVSDTVFIPVRIMGDAADHDRKVNYEVMDISTADPESYTLLPAVIKANKFEGTLPVLIRKTPSLKNKEGKLWIAITASDDFDPGVSDQLSYLIKINDFLSRPPSWSDSYFGKYSSVKYGFMIQKTGYTSFDNLGVSEMRFIAQNCKNALLEYEAQNGNMYDEVGDLVIFP
ncbi:hypothetical protein ABIE26_004235 [Pedobacter africanus]|uniref:Uncharacterized protein n=1 Tax=Pedobacter africanus TaxID=151894 RepID=A0ACC6L280_9SPHI|nr:DUF4843 domain-containing protein [Pedobacter africanus]MDR6785525.1 hypothetical protein [Pedobacter africanus]